MELIRVDCFGKYMRAARPAAIFAVAMIVVSSVTSCAKDEPILLFEDDFTGTQLRGDNWTTCLPWAAGGGGCTNSPDYDRQWYQDENVSVEDGNLVLTARAERANNPKYKYTSGIVTTGGDTRASVPPSFSFTYGYAEIRAKLPAGRGMWPAFWLLPTDYRFPPEIDVLEYQGVNPSTYLVNTHWRSANNDHAQAPHEIPVADSLTSGYHTYGIEWRAERLVWYFDGTEVARQVGPEGIPRQPMYLLLNLAIGGWVRENYPPAASAFPARYEIDYIKVWDRH